MNITNILNKLIENVELAVPELKIFQNYRITVGGQNITQINLRIHIYRRAVFYAYTVVAPSILLCILTVFSFWLPSGNVKKIDIGLTVFLFLYFLQVMIAENTPESNSTPLIGTFLTMVMTLNSISLIFATIVLHIHIRSKNEPCPTPHPLLWYLITNIFGYLAMIPYQKVNHHTTNTTNNNYIDNDQFETSLKDNSYDLHTLNHQRSMRDERTSDPNKRLVNTNDIVMDTPPLSPPPPPSSPPPPTTTNNNQYNKKLFFINQYSNEINITRWLYIARVVDRLLFQIYLITTIISIFVFLIYLPTSYDIKL
uniref:Neur_chan_memb domain-containing protein n=1 Tax=Schistosoma mansoni TaxID=6183 RepID=A0A5K4F588_SCHMA